MLECMYASDNFNESHIYLADYVLTVSANSITVNEDGTEGKDIIISETGYTFGNVNFTVTPLTYTQYQTITGRDLNELFPQLPPAASGKNRGIMFVKLNVRFKLSL